MARTDKYKKGADAKEVDLVPFMNLLAILIPALLISTEYIKIATIAVSSPRIGPKSEVVEQTDEKPPLNLTIAISSLGFYIASANNVLPGAEAAAEQKPGPTIPKTTVKVYRARDKMGRMKEVMRVWNNEGKKYILGVKEISPEDLQGKIDNYKSAHGSLQVTEELDFNFPALNAKLKVIKKAFEKENRVIVSSDPDIKFTTIIRVMDGARRYVNDEGERVLMFPQVILSAGIV